MTEPPRRMPPTPAERLNVVVSRVAGGSAAGQTRFARPVPPSTRPANRTKPPTVGDMNPVIIGEGTVVTPADGSGVGVAINGTVNGDQATGVGYIPNVNGDRSTGIGYLPVVDGDDLTVVGSDVEAHGTGSALVGYASGVWGTASFLIGTASSVGAPGAPADNAGTIGNAVHAPNTNDLIVGNSANNVQVPGTLTPSVLILADSSGGLHRLVVSTGGALSTVAYP